MKQNLLAVKILLCRAFGATHLQQVLEQTGLEKADIEAIQALPDDAKDFKPEDYVGKVATGYETKLLNSPEFLGKITIDKLPDPIKKTIEAGQYGRFMNEFKSLAKNKGIDFSDLTEEEQKSLNKFGEKIFSKYEGKLNNPEAVTKLQGELQAALQAKAALETDLPTKLKDIETTTVAKYDGEIKKMIAVTELQAIEGLKVKPGFVVDSLMSSLSSKYLLVKEGTSIKLMQKDNPTLKAIDNKGKEITFSEALMEEAKAGDLIGEGKKKEEDQTTGKGKASVIVNGSEVIPDHIKNKIEKNIEIENKK